MLKPEDMSVRLSSSGKARWIWWVDEIWHFFLCVFCVCYVCLENPKAFRNLGLRTLRRTPEGTTLQGLRTTSARRAKERSTSAPWTSDICHIYPHLHLRFRYFQILCSICCRTGLTGLKFDYLDLSSISLALKLTLIKIDWNSTDVMCLRASQSPSYCN